MPKVSVVIPAYNSERFIWDAIESVLGQTYRDFELIVVDDGSQDQTAQKIKGYDDRLTYLYQPNSGQARARNLGHTHSSGEYLAFLDSDDGWYPKMLEIEVRAMDDNPQAGLVYSDVDIIDEEGKLLQERYLAQRAKRKKPKDSFVGYHWIPFPSASLKRRDIFEKAGCFDVSFYQGGEDVLLWAKMYRLADFQWVPQSLSQRRFHRHSSKHLGTRHEAHVILYNKLWTFFADDPDRQTDLLVAFARFWSREGQRLVKERNLASGRECFRRSFRFYPFYFRNYIRLIRSYFYRRLPKAKPEGETSPDQRSL